MPYRDGKKARIVLACDKGDKLMRVEDLIGPDVTGGDPDANPEALSLRVRPGKDRLTKTLVIRKELGEGIMWSATLICQDTAP